MNESYTFSFRNSRVNNVKVKDLAFFFSQVWTGVRAQLSVNLNKSYVYTDLEWPQESHLFLVVEIWFQLGR